MARFDVYTNPGPHAGTTPYLLDVQSDLLDGLDTTVVIPLRRADAFLGGKTPPELMPRFLIDDVECLLETPKLAAVPRRMLKSPVASLALEGSRVVAALDFLFQGGSEPPRPSPRRAVLTFPESVRAWPSAEFATILKREIEALPPASLPLEQGLSGGSFPADDPVSVTLFSAQEEGGFILADLGILYGEINAGCSCGFDAVTTPAYARFRLTLSQETGQGQFRVIEESD